MKKFIFCIILFFSLIICEPIFRDGKVQDDSKVPALNPKLVNYINSMKTSWTAQNHDVRFPFEKKIKSNKKKKYYFHVK